MGEGDAWSASMDGVIEDVPLSPDINDCDGYRYIRFPGILRSNLFTKSRARVQLIEIPFTFERLLPVSAGCGARRDCHGPSAAAPGLVRVVWGSTDGSNTGAATHEIANPAL